MPDDIGDEDDRPDLTAGRDLEPRIDPRFDMRSDAGGRDPDSHSATLRRYHRQLWGKPLPSGVVFDLDESLHHNSDLGEYWLYSDAIVHTYQGWTRPAALLEVLERIPAEERNAFYDLACTIGAYLVFPSGIHADGRWQQSINQSRGMHPRIRDRFDLTLECIRRHYAGEASPLEAVLARHADYFGLFGDFGGYVDHFLLNDLVSEDSTSVRFLSQFDDFAGDPLPIGGAAEYREYMERSMEFVRARNERIAAYLPHAG